MISAALHVQSGQVQPNPHNLHEESLPDLIHYNLVLAVQFGRGGHEASEDGVNATWGQESKAKGRLRLVPDPRCTLRIQRSRYM